MQRSDNSCVSYLLTDYLHLSSPLTSLDRPKAAFEVIAELWNSTEFNPIAPASDCYVDYVSATIFSYEQAAALSPATPKKIQDIFASMRSDLLRIVSRWYQSGQGEGGVDRDKEYRNHDAADFLSCASLSVSDDAQDQERQDKDQE